MKKTLSLLSLAALIIGLLGSCSKINERLDGLDKRINNLENDKIASVEQQIAAINQSIADLGTIRTNIQTLIEAKTAQGEDITKLKEADQALEGKVTELESYVNTELAKYATTEWANATFATLEKQAEIIAAVTKLKQDLAGLDAALDQNIEDLDSSLKVWVNEQLSAYSTTAQMEAKIKALQDQIDALKADNETNKSDIEELEAGLAELEEDLAAAKESIKTAYEKAIKDALESNNGYITEKIKRAISSANGSISSLSSRVGTLETQVGALRGDVDALKGMIQSVTIIPAYSDGSVEAVNGILTLNCIVSPAEAISGMESLKDSLLLYADSVKVKTKATTDAYMTIKVTEASVLDADQGAITLQTDISEYLPKGEDKALTVAVNISSGISDFTTEFVPVTVTTKPIVTVTFDLNGITGTAPEAQKVAIGGKVTKPADPTYANHTFAGWYKTKDATTGALSDPWDFDNDTVTADMTLYAQWTKSMKDLLGNDFPKSSGSSIDAPKNAWTNKNGYKAYIYNSDQFFKLDPGNSNGLAFFTSYQFTRISDSKYVFNFVNGNTSYGVFTLKIEDSKLVSIEYDGTGTAYVELSGTYSAPVSKEYVEIEAKYNGNDVSTLRWYKQNLAITDSGRKAWTDDNGSPVKVPGTDEDVVVGDYFQWGTFAGFYGSGADPEDKGLLPYSSFTSTGCGDGSNNFTFKSGKQFNQTNAPYWSGSAYTKYNATDEKTELDASDDVASIILGGTWRMPTTKEFQALKEVTYWAWDATDKGYYVYTPNPESDAGKVNNGTGTYNKADALLFFPTAGNGYENTYYDVESIADYWASSRNSTSEKEACHLYFNYSGSVNADSRNSDRYRGYSVRPVQDPAATYVAVTNVSLDETSKNITVGGNLQLKATVIPDDATQQGVYWTSDKPAVATVDPYGKVTGVAAGTVTITATTVDGSKTATCVVTVKAETIADVLATVDGGFPEDKSGGTSPVAPSNAWTNENGSSAFIFSSALILKNDGYTYGQLNTMVTKGENCYTASISYGNLEFNMTNGILTSFKFIHDPTKPNGADYDGIYTAPTTN